MNDCIEEVNSPLISFKEKKSQLIINNPSRKICQRIKVDDCMIKIGKRCDFMLVITQTNVEHFIELKGQDLDHALVQIETTIRKLSKNALDPRVCFIICTRVPMISAKIQSLRVAFKKKYNSVLHIGSSPFRYTI